MGLKKIVFGFFFVITITAVYCQDKFEISDAKSMHLETGKSIYDGAIKIPYKEFIVKDFRFDSSKLGYIRKMKISLKKNSSEGLSDLLNYHFKNALDTHSDKSLLIVIKKLWLQKDGFDIVSNDKIRPKSPGANYLKTGVCIADIEVYCKTYDGYYPVIKIADNFFYSRYSESQLINFLLLPFDSLLKKAADVDITKVVTHKKPYTAEEINVHYSSRFEIPVLKTISTTKGVFKTFDDFKTNKTAYPDFVVKKTKVTDEIYVIENNKEELLTDFWGYYDGKDYYMKCGFNFYKMFRQNNSWDIYGGKYISENYGQFHFESITINTVATGEMKKPLQLDMETGKLY